jgi:hypothetical protein
MSDLPPRLADRMRAMYEACRDYAGEDSIHAGLDMTMLRIRTDLTEIRKMAMDARLAANDHAR